MWYPTSLVSAIHRRERRSQPEERAQRSRRLAKASGLAPQGEGFQKNRARPEEGRHGPREDRRPSKGFLATRLPTRLVRGEQNDRDRGSASVTCQEPHAVPCKSRTLHDRAAVDAGVTKARVGTAVSCHRWTGVPSSKWVFGRA